MKGDCQIIKMAPKAKGEARRRWEFMAHGAIYSKTEADELQPVLEARGYKVRRLPVPSK